MAQFITHSNLYQFSSVSYLRVKTLLEKPCPTRKRGYENERKYIKKKLVQFNRKKLRRVKTRIGNLVSIP